LVQDESMKALGPYYKTAWEQALNEERSDEEVVHDVTYAFMDTLERSTPAKFWDDLYVNLFRLIGIEKVRRETGRQIESARATAGKPPLSKPELLIAVTELVTKLAAEDPARVISPAEAGELTVKTYKGLLTEEKRAETIKKLKGLKKQS
jgi:hypothetical protein